ncbi:MAG: hypothetical protein M3P91_12180, partial [Actinomycetota bacterium]|nr:hypothetical protein [Actinomycetota bacterium]
MWVRAHVAQPAERTDYGQQAEQRGGVPNQRAAGQGRHPVAGEDRCAGQQRPRAPPAVTGVEPGGRERHPRGGAPGKGPG